jgi:hypothetical protein
MGPAIPAIMIAVAVAGAAQQFMATRQQAANDQKIASIQAKQAVEQTTAQYAEIDRQEREVNRIAEEQRSDRMRKAYQEMGTLRVLAGERGASAQTTNALLGEVGYFAGLDLSRIEQNRKANIDAGEASKKAAHQGAINVIDIASNQSKVASKTVNMALIGTGIQIAGESMNITGDYLDKKAQREAARDQAQ